MLKKSAYLLSLISLSLSIVFPVSNAFAATTTEQKTAAAFNQIKSDPLKLYMFLVDMPKGGDLHNHSAGATYAENLLHYAENDTFCIDKQTYIAQPGADCENQWKIANIKNNPDLYSTVVDAWSVDNFVPNDHVSEEQHFFDTFYKFFPVVGGHAAEVFKEVVARAGWQHESYMELFITLFDLNMGGAKGDPVMQLAQKLGWNDDFAKMREKLLANGLLDIVKQASTQLTAIENNSRKLMHCGEKNADAGCQVKVRYQYIALREMPRELVFAQLLAGFEAAQHDPRIVGVNLVQAEDGPISVRDYNLHMQMIQFLHKLYPNVHISLHAGELAPESVTPEVLRYHIRNAVEIAGANRIGHGVDIAYEDNAQQLLKEMADKKIMVEINLTSNEKLLNISGDHHPLRLYLQNHVPVALSTDDEGVARTDLTREYAKATTTYHLDYLTLKQFARNSITYSFLPGKSLWTNAEKNVAVKDCVQDQLGTDHPTSSCQEFLIANEKAEQQWLLERQFNQFEQLHT